MEACAEIILKQARYFNVFSESIEQADILIRGEYIVGIGSYTGENELDFSGKILVPGLIDGHIHLESSMLTPREFAKVAAQHGTAAAICDPHEIANVCGTDGLEYMLQCTKDLPVDCFFVLPSCVPAAPGEENGATLTASELKPYYKNPRVIGLGEVMNVPGVINQDPDLMQKLSDAAAAKKRIDGHAPGLCGAALDCYLAAGVQTDHECSTLAEAREKLRRGMWIMLREGTAAHNLAALLPLLNEPGAERCLFVTDDKHPDELVALGHIDSSVRRAISSGVAPARAVKTASLNAAQCFGLDHYGAIAPGYFANFFITDDIELLPVLSTWHKGKVVYDGTDIPCKAETPPKKAITDTFHCPPFTDESFCGYPAFPCEGIGLIPGEILTTCCNATPQNSVLLAVAERHKNTGHIGKAYLCGYGLSQGAIASSIAHDSHNLIIAGTNKHDMAVAAEAIRQAGGGLAAVRNGKVLSLLPLPIGGIMSDLPAQALCRKLEELRKAVASLGNFAGIDPFMTLAFISLPVIPKIRLTAGGIVHLD